MLVMYVRARLVKLREAPPLGPRGKSRIRLGEASPFPSGQISGGGEEEQKIEVADLRCFLHLLEGGRPGRGVNSELNFPQNFKPSL